MNYTADEVELMVLSDLVFEAEALIGRPVELLKTKDGKFIVDFMSLTEAPPPKGDNEKEALRGFIEWCKLRPKKILPEIDLPPIKEDDDI